MTSTGGTIFVQVSDIHISPTDRRRRPRDARVGRDPASRWRDRALIGKLIGRLACLNVTAKGAVPLGSYHPSAC